MAILAELTSDDVLDTAYDWLCRRRRAYPADADVWSFRQRKRFTGERLGLELELRELGRTLPDDGLKTLLEMGRVISKPHS